jgi:hypothetical protein
MSILDLSLNLINFNTYHDKDYKFICEKCKFYTDSSSSFARHTSSSLHITGVHGRRKYPKDLVLNCTICEFTSTSVHTFNSHILNKHVNNQTRNTQYKFYCNTCNFGSMSKSKFDKHIQSFKHTRNQSV